MSDTKITSCIEYQGKINLKQYFVTYNNRTTNVPLGKGEETLHCLDKCQP